MDEPGDALKARELRAMARGLRSQGDDRGTFARDAILREASALGVCREDRAQLEALARYAFTSPEFRAVTPVRLGDDHHERMLFEVCHADGRAVVRPLDETTADATGPDTPEDETIGTVDPVEPPVGAVFADAADAPATDSNGLAALFADTAAHSPDLVAVFSSTGRPLSWANDAFRSRLHVPEWASPHLVEVLDDWSQGHFVVKVLPDLVSKGWWQGRLSMVGPDVPGEPMVATIVSHRGDDGAIDSLVLTAQPAPAPVEVPAKADRDDRFAALVEHVSDLIAVIEPSGTIRYASPAASTMLGHAPGELTGMDVLDLLHPDEVVEAIDDLVRPTRVEHHPSNNGQHEGLGGTPASTAMRPTSLRLRAADGSWRFIEAVVTDLTDNPAIGGFVLNARDVTEREQAHEQLQVMAYSDPGTKLPNRLRLLDRLTNLLEDTARAGPLAVLLVDIDEFRSINETHGSEVGDALVSEIAKRLVDGAGPDALVARLRDDEFGVALPDVSDGNVAARAADALKVLLSRPIDHEEGTLRVTASIGISLGEPGDEPEELLRRADRAVSAARRAGGNRTEHWGEELARKDGQRRHVEAQLRRVLDDGGITVHYQPIVSVADRTVVGAEALLRVRDDAGPLLNPAEFVEAAESAGLIAQVGGQMLRATCEQLSLWGAQLRSSAPEHISVNVSPRQLVDPGLGTQVMAALEAVSIEPHRLWLEVTESTLIGQHSVVSERISFLRDLGVKVGLDEFGAGYSTLDYLRRFPLDFVKIDRSLITGLGIDGRDTAIVRATVELAHSLGLVVVAVGVEEEGQLDHLRSLGCDQAQGYLFFPPLDAAALVTDLRG